MEKIEENKQVLHVKSSDFEKSNTKDSYTPSHSNMNSNLDIME